jgi:site-specific recombinase XerD
MTLTQMLENAMIERSCLPNTRETYHIWVKRFYRFVGKPASQWTPDDVRVWMLDLHRLGFANTSRKQALCAVKFVFDHVLKRELGWLDLPPMPIVRQTLRIIPSREELVRIFENLNGQSKLMAAIMYGSMIYAHGDRARGFSPLDFGPTPTPVMVSNPFAERLLA